MLAPRKEVSFADIMVFAVELDTWRERFKGLLDFKELPDTTGYKFIIENGLCQLDLPSWYQHVKRWYYGYSQEKFYEFLVEYKTDLILYLEKVISSGLSKSQRYEANHLVAQIFSFVVNLSRACSLARSVYPENDKLRKLLIDYFHDMNKWLQEVG